MKKRGFILIAAVLFVLLLGAAPILAATSFPIYLDGKQLTVDSVTEDGITTIKLRQFAETLGFDVDFKDGKILLTSNKKEEPKESLKITTLAENKNDDHPHLMNEFGFSAYIEYGDDRIIFDTSKEGGFLTNAKTLNIDLGKADALVLSHAHYDHCGGVIPYFNAYDPSGKILYVKDCFFDLADNKYYHDPIGQKFDFTDGTPGYFPVGINFSKADLKAKNVTVEYINADRMRIGKNVTLYGNFHLSSNDEMAPNMLVKDNGQYKLYDFDEEVALAIDTNKGLVIVSGCSHTGILNIVNSIQERSGKKVYAVIGGFHLLDASEEKIQSTIDRFKELGVEEIGLSHCTGPKATQMFQEQMPDRVFINETGSIFEVK
jgi:7,8-dihydropterin-6-yl-methyl-4-(beta-D-ribofuranosyl)aminobenzene 5'-phosphate synthase